MIYKVTIKADQKSLIDLEDILDDYAIDYEVNEVYEEEQNEN